VKKSADGNSAIPGLTQVFGTTWEISLATFLITTGGVITVTDARVFRKSTSVVGTNELTALSVTSAILGALSVIAGKIADGAVDTTARLANNIVTAAKMFQLAGLSVLGRSANTTGDMAAITGTDGQALRVAGTVLGFGTLTSAAYGALSVVTAAINDLAVTTGKLAALAVTTAKMALDSVDDTIVGNRVPALTRRQGGSATNWSTPGTTTYTPTMLRMQPGAITLDGSGLASVTFPIAFSNVPLVYLASQTSTPPTAVSISASGVTIQGNPADVAMWLAIGPE
jgi:hypothetical protein